jgi:hypothetical protein
VEILLPNSSCTVRHTVKEPTVFQCLAVAQKLVSVFTSTEHRFPVKISGLLTIPLSSWGQGSVRVVLTEQSRKWQVPGKFRLKVRTLGRFFAKNKSERHFVMITECRYHNARSCVMITTCRYGIQLHANWCCYDSYGWMKCDLLSYHTCPYHPFCLSRATRTQRHKFTFRKMPQGFFRFDWIITKVTEKNFQSPLLWLSHFCYDRVTFVMRVSRLVGHELRFGTLQIESSFTFRMQCELTPDPCIEWYLVDDEGVLVNYGCTD